MKNYGIKSEIYWLNLYKNEIDEIYIKIKLNSGDDLPPNKTIEIPVMTIVVGAVFMKITNIIIKVFLDEHFYKL